jgi:mono/diheme cytochrome c family protein
MRIARNTVRTALSACVALAVSGCQQEMAKQPTYRPLQSSTYFADGMASRPLVPGTIHRDAPLGTENWAVDVTAAERAASVVGKLAANPLEAESGTAAMPVYVDTFPLSVTEKVLLRGQDRFNIYCALCHDRVGTGNGMIVQRGFTKPPNLHTDWSRGLALRGIKVKLTDAPVGYLYDVVSRGYGAMPDYAGHLKPDDRWAVIAYVRALQFSQSAQMADVRDEMAKKQLLQTRENK